MSQTGIGTIAAESGSTIQKGESPRRYLHIALGCLLVMLVLLAAGARGLAIPERYFLPVHLVLEFSSIVVTFAVFTTGWFGYQQTGRLRDLIIGATFIAAGAIDFIHTLSYKGMPDFVGANSPGKAAAYWMLARLIVAVGLLCAAAVSPEKRARWLAPKALLVIAMIAVAVPTAIITHFPQSGQLFYDLQSGTLTPLKIALEYVLIIAYLAAAVAIRQQGGWGPRTVTSLRQGLILAAFAEVCFTLYLSPFSPINAFGHILKTIAYYFILRALFVSAIRKPYEELSKATEKLQALYQDAQEHRREIEMSFSRIGSALSSSLQLDEALDRIAELATDMLHADCAVVASVDSTGEISKAGVLKGGCHEADRPIDLLGRLSKPILEARQSRLENDLESSGLVECSFKHADCLRAMICTPMTYEGTILGLVAIFSHSAGAFNDGDVNLLQAFASHAAVAIHNAMSYERESRIADALQRSLLTPMEVNVEGFEFAHVYQPAMNEALVGGDFYDVFRMPGGKIGLVIGDVSGKGLAAAMYTAQVKYALRAYMNEEHPPATALRLLNDSLSQHIAADTFVTMFFGILDTNTGEMVYANAGHEPPLYVIDGRSTELPATGAAVGLIPGSSYEEVQITLMPGSILLLYTDGISEARHEMDFLGVERISEKLLVCDDLGSDDIARCIHQSAIDFAGGELRDDAAILAVKATRK